VELSIELARLGAFFEGTPEVHLDSSAVYHGDSSNLSIEVLAKVGRAMVTRTAEDVVRATHAIWFGESGLLEKYVNCAPHFKWSLYFESGADRCADFIYLAILFI